MKTDFDIEMVFVQGGTFMMGATSEQGSEWNDNEKPVHQVTLSDYYIGKYQVTQKQWEAVMGNNPSELKGDNLPVENVSWYDAQEFIHRLNEITGKNYRLPTEAEWEYAARGGNKSQGYKYSGSNNINDVAWYVDNSDLKTHPVGTKQPNELSIYDMSGNVSEWCNDWYEYYTHTTKTNPTGPLSGAHIVFRGGSCLSEVRYLWSLRVSNRIRNTPCYRYMDIGLRLACSSDCDKSLVEDVVESNVPTQLLDIEKLNANESKILSLKQHFKESAFLEEIEMVFVQGGTFMMGATSEQGSDCDDDDEKPVHQVTLSDFFIGKYPITQKQWEAVMGNNPSFFKGDNLPVENVSWHDAQEFIYLLNELTEKKYRLPTEAEWMYAARGGNESRGYKYCGSNNVSDVAWYEDNSDGKTHPVGTKQPNELSIYDMLGNVREWCNDLYDDYTKTAKTNPTGPSSGSERVICGCCWGAMARFVRVSSRSHDQPRYSDNNIGFRLGSSSDCVKSLVELEEIEMVFVEGGTFMMGATAEQGTDCLDREKPVHQVTLSDFFIGKYTITQKQWKAVMDNNPSKFEGDNFPVDNVSWHDVQEFINRLNELSEKKYRLPTEAEWEYAARGGNKSQGFKYSGSNNVYDVAWHRGNIYSRTHMVGAMQPNELSIYDMSGNVWEWCNDWYGDYTNTAKTNPAGPSSGSYRVLRGGSYGGRERNVRVSDRDYDAPGYRNSNFGLRLVSTSQLLDIEKLNENESEKQILSQKQQFKESAFLEEIEMVFVEGGTFMMGATAEQGTDCRDNEKPVHQVTLSDYYIGKYQVTQKQWEAVMGNNPSDFKGDNLPVENVSWHDAQKFINRLNELTGKKYRLPTEAEWEYVARGGNESRGYKYSGSNNISDVAWYDDNFVEETHPVGTKQANELGIFDMSGNVWEFCNDWYDKYTNTAKTNPTGPSSGSDRVNRGGSWYEKAKYMRMSFRGSLKPDSCDSNFGFRLASSSDQVCFN